MFHSRCKRTISELEARNADLQRCIEELRASNIEELRASEAASAKLHAEHLAKKDASIEALSEALESVSALAGRDERGDATLAVVSSAIPERIDAAQLPFVRVAVEFLGLPSSTSTIATHFILCISAMMTRTLIAPQFTRSTTASFPTASHSVVIVARLSGRIDLCWNSLEQILRGQCGLKAIAVRSMSPSPLCLDVVVRVP
jgi:hypothetical protein